MNSEAEIQKSFIFPQVIKKNQDNFPAASAQSFSRMCFDSLCAKDYFVESLWFLALVLDKRFYTLRHTVWVYLSCCVQ